MVRVINLHLTVSHHDLGYYPLHKLDMHRLIADECANFRSILKKVAIAAVNKHYDVSPKLGAINDHAAYFKYAKRAAAALLDESDFLRDGVDDMVCKWNLV